MIFVKTMQKNSVTHANQNMYQATHVERAMTEYSYTTTFYENHLQLRLISTKSSLLYENSRTIESCLKS